MILTILNHHIIKLRRLLPCTVFTMLVGEEEENHTVQLNKLTEAVLNLPNDGEAFIKEWGCRSIRCVLETENMVFEFQEGLQAIDAALKAMSCHPEHLGVAENACGALATALAKTDAWAQLFAQAPKRFGQAAQKIVRLCLLVVHVHKNSLRLQSAAIEVFHYVVTFAVDKSSKLGFALHEAQNRQVQDVLGMVIAGLDLVFENGSVTERALEILVIASEKERSRILIACAQGERVLQRVENAYDASSELGRRIYKLCEECKSNCKTLFQGAEKQAQLLRTQYEVSLSALQAEGGSDELESQQENCERLLVSVKHSLQSDSLVTARSGLKILHENIALGQCHKSVEGQMWLLHHQCQGLTALNNARLALDAGFPENAQSALADADRELQKGDNKFYLSQKEELLKTAHNIVECRHHLDELSTREFLVTKGNAALHAAKEILATHVGEFEMDFGKVLDRVADDHVAVTEPSTKTQAAVAANNNHGSSSASVDQNGAVTQSPAWRRGHLQEWSEQNWTPSCADAPPAPPRGASGHGSLLLLAGAPTAEATQDVASVGNRPREDTKEDGKPSSREKTAAQNVQKEDGEFFRKESAGADERRTNNPFDRLAELFRRMLEAQKAFGKIQEDR